MQNQAGMGIQSQVGTGTRNLRKTIVINKKFQHQYALILVALTVLFCNVLLLINMFIPGPQSLNLSSSAAAWVGTVELVLIAGVWYLSLRSTHRIAGPIFVFSRQLRAYGAGDLTARITLRKTDMFQEEAREINSGLEQLQSSVDEIKALAVELQATYKGGADIGPQLEKLSASLQDLRTQGKGH